MTPGHHTQSHHTPRQRRSGDMCVTETAKALGQKPKEFFAWLAKHQWIYKRGERDPWMAFNHRVNAGLLRNETYRVPAGYGPDRQVTQVLVTPHGYERLREIFQQHH